MINSINYLKIVVNIIHLHVECKVIKMSRAYLVLEFKTQILRTKLNEKTIDYNASKSYSCFKNILKVLDYRSQSL